MALELFDTHCHIQSAGQKEGERGTQRLWAKDPAANRDEVAQRAREAGVNRLLCVGCDLEDSRLAINYAQGTENVWASIGIHPHEAKLFADDKAALQEFSKLATEKKVVAVGECGLDYYYEHSPKEKQMQLLEFMIDLAIKQDLSLIFHVREAFDDFWPILDGFSGYRGVVHSFSSNGADLEQILSRGLYVGLNGIMTFTKDSSMLEAAKAVPTDRLLLETDAPFLTPAPYRGTICEPRHVAVTAEFLSRLRGESFEILSQAATNNGRRLFNV